YDYLGSLRRLTDNSFTASVPDMYENFIRASHMWSYLTATKRLGQAHGIDKLLVFRPDGNLQLYCPACPEAGFNCDEKLRDVPNHLKHLNQQQDTLDGNFHCNQATKNTDPGDTSLYEGKTFFPHHEEFKEYIEAAPTKEDPPTCNYLKAVNNQDKKKFKNMAITGIVNTQCSHVFVKASVDMQFGERYVAPYLHPSGAQSKMFRYANVDASLAHAIRQNIKAGHKGTIAFEFNIDPEALDGFQADREGIDRIVSYDSACQYSVNIVERFEKFFPDLLPFVEKMRWSVPALHVQGHQEGCLYAYSTAYMVGVGHFHGETAEHYWPELNQIGTQVRQMNGGHRQDVIINNHNDWNYKKTAKIAVALKADLVHAERLFLKHTTNFLALCARYKERIARENWLDQDREANKKSMKNVLSVYRHKHTEVPSQRSVYLGMLAKEAEIGAEVPLGSKNTVFLNEGLGIQEEQRKLQKLAAALKKDVTTVSEEHLAATRAKLQTRVDTWRREQLTITPQLGELLAAQAGCDVEEEVLYLPSDFTEDDRAHLGLQILASDEGKLQEGAIFDWLKKVQLAAQTLQTLDDRGRKQGGGKKNTKTAQQKVDVKDRRNKHIEGYMSVRQALIALNMASGIEDFPPLTAEDTRMKSRQLGRQLGDLQREEGLVWTMAGIGVSRAAIGDSSSAPPSQPIASSSTPYVKKTRAMGTTKAKKTREDGWLWKVGGVGTKSAEDIQKWLDEGDRVQWFRAEADMERWQEQIEARLANIRCTIRSFRTYKHMWTTLAAT
ncbi:hypothetical protein C8J57DRAFT_1029924, partial [Mycena rebaudengoi]